MLKELALQSDSEEQTPTQKEITISALLYGNVSREKELFFSRCQDVANSFALPYIQPFPIWFDDEIYLFIRPQIMSAFRRRNNLPILRVLQKGTIIICLLDACHYTTGLLHFIFSDLPLILNEYRQASSSSSSSSSSRQQRPFEPFLAFVEYRTTDYNVTDGCTAYDKERLVAYLLQSEAFLYFVVSTSNDDAQEQVDRIWSILLAQLHLQKSSSFLTNTILY